MRLFRFEHRSEPLASRRVFLGRVAARVLWATVFVAVFIAVGAVFYHDVFYHAGSKPSWIGALHRASMILSGMGPVGGEPESDAERVFDGVYALISAFVLVGVMGLTLAPIFHRVLHHLHVGEDD
jgi:hypothetical protein